MQFRRYLLAVVLSAIFAEATEHTSSSNSKETSKRTAQTASSAIHSHETARATLKYEDYNYGHEAKDYDSIKTSHGYKDKEHNTTKITHENTKTRHENTHATHATSIHSAHLYTAHHNASTVLKNSMKHLATSIATSTEMASATHIEKSTVTVIHAKSTYMAVHTSMMNSIDTTMVQSISTVMASDVFTLNSCTDCITEPVQTGLATASVSAQDFTMSMTASAVSDAMMTTPTYNMPLTLATTLSSATTSAPSAGFATTSRAVFTGSGGKQSMNYVLAAVLAVLVGLGGL